MHSITVWTRARRPNYDTNVDKTYPYSEVPYLGDYHLVKLPVSTNEHIEHVDYWGEGKIDTQHGRSGYSDCYNVNHPFQLVSNGEDRDRKIPNRIPVSTYALSDTSAYIKDNSVKIVTVMGAPININCAADIARIVNNDVGKVVVYGFDTDSQDIINLTTALKARQIYHCPDYNLPDELQGLTLFNRHMAFLNVTELKNLLCKLVTDGKYDAAIAFTRAFDRDDMNTVISKTVDLLLHSNSTVDEKLLSYAFKLWDIGYQEVIKKYFPISIKRILGQEDVTIMNKGYRQALKLDTRTITNENRLVWGDSQDFVSKKVNWRFVPVWVNNDVTFYLYSVEYDMYLTLDETPDSMGDRKALGSKHSGDRQRFYVTPYMKDGNLVFYLINHNFRQGLKLVVDTDTTGDRLLMGHNGDIYNGEERFMWTILPWSPQT